VPIQTINPPDSIKRVGLFYRWGSDYSATAAASGHAAAGHSALQHESFFSQVAAFSQVALQHESGFWHSAFGQHSVAGLSQQLSCLQAAFLQQPIAATAMAAISKIFFITLKNY
jgi:hypothetical protein